ncbi:MAG: RNA polymerase sigma factor [Ancalomicrobiaceae bacterium]|nr:RNA polymerase sigma factor [Ancalomicrobiaceae bacterium]
MARLNCSLQTELNEIPAGGHFAAIDPPFSVGMRPRDEDEELLARIAADDQGAFRSLVGRHIDRAYGLALRMLGNPADADDVVQDSFLKVWTHRHRWEFGRAKFSTWLYRVITNRCIDLHRMPRMGDIDETPEIADARDDVLTELHRANVTSLLEAAMARLPDQQRIALVLSYHETMSNPEIAEAMGTTVTAVESLLKRGRQHLRKLLDGAKEDITQSFTDA